jgi:Tol biopolymer transport system component
VAETVKSDVACALDIPPSLITVSTGDAACAWASDFNERVAVELTLHKLCAGSAGGHSSEPVALAAAIASQHADPSSRLWRGYLTKTLDSDVVPEVVEVTASADEFTTCATGVRGKVTKASYPNPSSEDRSGRDAKISRDGLWVGFQSDSDFKSTGLAVHADEAHHVWMKDLSGGALHLLSNASKPSDKDAKSVSVDSNGAHACFHSEVPGEESIMKWTREGNVLERITSNPDDPETNMHSPDGMRDAFYCDISADGSCIVFVSDAELADANETHKCNPSAEQKGCVTVGKSKEQVYLTCDDGESFTMVTPPTLATSARSASAQVSGDGTFVAFRSSAELIEGVAVSGRDEAYLYEVETGLLEKVTNQDPTGKCDSGVIYANLVELYTEEKLENVSITRGSTSSCNYAVKEGWFSHIGSVGVMQDSPSISDSARFLSFTSNFAAADTYGTYQATLIASWAHLFLFDAHLGVTWQLTSDGVPGAEYDQFVEAFCCPGASASKQRGACEEKYEIQGQCCWQKPCGFPALNAELSGDGNSIVFISDNNHADDGHAIFKDLELFHFYIPTATFTRITKTSNEDYDEADPSVSYNGDRIAWTSDFDFVNKYSVVDANQVFVTELALGCSGSAAAANYLEAPDVQTCCTWSEEIQPYPAGAEVATVTLTFNLNQSAMMERIPFKSLEEVDPLEFCGRVAETVKSDVACALDIPPSLITVSTVDAACAWASDFNERVAVELTLHKLCAGRAGDLPEPVALAAAIVSQHADPSSRLWRGYLTKTLDGDVVPEVVEVAASEEVADCAAEGIVSATTEFLMSEESLAAIEANPAAAVAALEAGIAAALGVRSDAVEITRTVPDLLGSRRLRQGRRTMTVESASTLTVEFSVTGDVLEIVDSLLVEDSTVVESIQSEVTSALAAQSIDVTIVGTQSVTPDPTPSPTPSPTPLPTANPTASPTASPTAEPTSSPTPEPTANPTPEPTPSPTASDPEDLDSSSYRYLLPMSVLVAGLQF